MIVDLFIPCFVDQFYPETALNMIKVLERVGCGVNYNHEQTCCGQRKHIFNRDRSKNTFDKTFTLKR